MERLEDWIITSVKSRGKLPVSSSSCRVCVKLLSGLVSGSAKLIIPGTCIIENTFLEANSNLMELTPPEIDRSVAKREVGRVEKSL